MRCCGQSRCAMASLCLCYSGPLRETCSYLRGVNVYSKTDGCLPRGCCHVSNLQILNRADNPGLTLLPNDTSSPSHLRDPRCGAKNRTLGLFMFAKDSEVLGMLFLRFPRSLNMYSVDPYRALRVTFWGARVGMMQMRTVRFCPMLSATF
jgi:hypothetical protein